MSKYEEYLKFEKESKKTTENYRGKNKLSEIIKEGKKAFERS